MIDFPIESVDRYKIRPKRMEPYTPVRHISTRMYVATQFSMVRLGLRKCRDESENSITSSYDFSSFLIAVFVSGS